MMRNHLRFSIGAAIMSAVVALAVTTVAGQAPASKAPRQGGKPNLNGIWQAVNEAGWDIEGHAAAPGLLLPLGAAGAVAPGLGVVEGGPLPYQPAAALQRKENFEKRLTLDPEVKCFLPGVPRATYMPYPFQIIQTPKDIGSCTRTRMPSARSIWIITRKLPGTAGWDGRTAAGRGRRWSSTRRVQRSDVVRPGRQFPQRRPARGRTLYATSPDHLLYEATIEDPKVFTRPGR